MSVLFYCVLSDASRTDTANKISQYTLRPCPNSAAPVILPLSDCSADTDRITDMGAGVADHRGAPRVFAVQIPRAQREMFWRLYVESVNAGHVCGFHAAVVSDVKRAL
jgi:hypothetical protein